MQELSLKEKLIIKEETDNLKKLRSISSALSSDQTNCSQAYRREISSLNETSLQSNIDDRAQISVHISRLETLAQHKYQPAVNINLENPYFAHIKLREEKKVRDLYIGNRVFHNHEAAIQIIDWKNSPISIIYFLYEEGDEYEEEIESRWFEGVVEVKRQLKIFNGEIVGIRQGDLLLSKDEEGWLKAQGQPALPTNGGDAGPGCLFDCSSGLERRKAKIYSANTPLSEITALIDSEQHAIITRSPNDIVAIQGVAGSGKTTVALHRIAWLNSKHDQRFAEESIMVMVFSKSLANYISKALSSLELDKIKTVCLEDWFSRQRERLFSGHLPRRYSSRTPASAVIFKKHPTLLKIINQFIDEKETSFNRELNEILDSREKFAFPDRLNFRPLISRLFSLRKWIDDTSPDSRKSVPDPEFKSLLQRLINKYINPEKPEIETLIQYWEELFSNFEHLKKKFQALSDDISELALKEAVNWLKIQYMRKHNPSSHEPDLFETISSFPENHKRRSKGFALDYEDNPILLYFYQKLLKPIADKGEMLKYSHLMIDEAQDLSVIELAVLLDINRKPRSLTLAGDANQKSVENSYRDWGMIFDDLDIKNQKISTLKVGYRSTRQIMDFAFSILGNSAAREFIPKSDGPPVKLLRFYNQGELMHFLSQALKELTARDAQASIALICLTPSEAEETYELLKRMETSRLRLVADQDFSFDPGIDVTDVKQVKGLEFDYVILPNVDHINYPCDEYSKYLLHIASTRAAYQLWLMNSRPPSPLLPQWLVDDQESNFQRI